MRESRLGWCWSPKWLSFGNRHFCPLCLLGSALFLVCRLCVFICFSSSLSLHPFFSATESRMASNDSDSELEEASEPLSSSDASALHRLSFLEQPEVEAGLEEGPQSRSGSEEQLEGEDGDPGQRLCAFNTNQSNNTARVPLPAMRLRGGQISCGTSGDRRPQFV